MLVTRPEPGASATARRLEALGHEPVVLPLTRTVPVAGAAVPSAAGFDAVLATSAAAIRHAPPALLAAIGHLPLHAVGERTAGAGREAGLERVAEPFADAAAMVERLPARLPAGARLLYLAGRVRTGLVEAGLAAAGLHVGIAEVYDTVPDDSATAAREIAAAPLGVALVYSANGARALSRLAVRPGMAGAFSGTRFLCISAIAAEALGPALARRAEAADRPDEAAMFALLGVSA